MLDSHRLNRDKFDRDRFDRDKCDRESRRQEEAGRGEMHETVSRHNWWVPELRCASELVWPLRPNKSPKRALGASIYDKAWLWICQTSNRPKWCGNEVCTETMWRDGWGVARRREKGGKGRAKWSWRPGKCKGQKLYRQVCSLKVALAFGTIFSCVCFEISDIYKTHQTCFLWFSSTLDQWQDKWKSLMNIYLR